VLLAEDDRAIAGLALWFPTFSTFLGRPGIWLEDLFVRPPFRGRGHGLALLQELRSMTDGRVEWAVLDWNEPSIRFYESLGARAVHGWTRYRWTVAGGQ
jgi:GNAT superfamily N-acetyltransferase